MDCLEQFWDIPLHHPDDNVPDEIFSVFNISWLFDYLNFILIQEIYNYQNKTN